MSFKAYDYLADAHVRVSVGEAVGAFIIEQGTAQIFA